LVTASADPCGSTTQQAVRLDDTMTVTLTLLSVGSSYSSTGKESNAGMSCRTGPEKEDSEV